MIALPALPEPGMQPRRVVRRRVVRTPAAPVSPPPPEPAEPRLLRPAATCPRCGARPAMRVTAAMVRALNGQETDVRVGTLITGGTTSSGICGRTGADRA